MFKVAVVQLKVGFDKLQNLNNAKQKIVQAAKNGSKLIILPEYFTCPVDKNKFHQYSETIPGGPSFDMLTEASKMNKVFIIGGSIPEEKDGKIYNCSMVFDERGEMIGKYRKSHLFDIDIPNGITFTESSVVSPGDSLLCFDCGPFRVGLGICYDLRFPILSNILVNKLGCDLLVFPAAFNTTTGPLHWSLLQRSRALDNQVFVVTASQASNSDTDYIYPVYGHSMIVDPK